MAINNRCSCCGTNLHFFNRSQRNEAYCDSCAPYIDEIEKLTKSYQDYLSKMKEITPENAIDVYVPLIFGNGRYKFWIEKNELKFLIVPSIRKMQSFFIDKNYETEFLGQTIIQYYNSGYIPADINSRIEIVSINKDEIQYFRESGSVYTTTSGSGGNSSYSLLNGHHGKINEVKIESKVHDTRCIEIIYNENQALKTLKITPMSIIHYLRKYMPEKEFGYVTPHETTNAKPTSLDNDSVIAEIRKFKQLYDEGILTEEEFIAKKKQLLGI